MKTLVTGAAGYIGSVTTEVLLDAGHDVIALDNLELGHRDAVHEDATFVHADLRDRDAVMRAFAAHRPEAVLHFAAYALVGESMERPESYFSNNLVGACNLFEAMFAHDCLRFVFSSSCTVYGQPETMPVTEALPRQALNPVWRNEGDDRGDDGVARAAARLARRDPALLQPRRCIRAVRRGSARMRRISCRSRSRSPRGKRPHLTILGTDYPTPDGTCIRDYIHVVDLAEAHVRALEALDRHRTARHSISAQGTVFPCGRSSTPCAARTDRPVPTDRRATPARRRGRSHCLCRSIPRGGRCSAGARRARSMT